MSKNSQNQADAEQKAFQKILGELLEVQENKFCADCRAKGPRWVGLVENKKMGCFICIKCSGIHRSLGVHISFVRSVTLDKWEAEQVRAMQAGGNKAVNDIYEATLPQDFARPSDTDGYSLEQFIRAKYERKLYYRRDGASSPSSNGTSRDSQRGEQRRGSHSAGSQQQSRSTSSGTGRTNNQQQQQSQVRQPTKAAGSASVAKDLFSFDDPPAPAASATAFGAFQSSPQPATDFSAFTGHTSSSASSVEEAFFAGNGGGAGLTAALAPTAAPSVNKESILNLYGHQATRPGPNYALFSQQPQQSMGQPGGFGFGGQAQQPAMMGYGQPQQFGGAGFGQPQMAGGYQQQQPGFGQPNYGGFQQQQQPGQFGYAGYGGAARPAGSMMGGGAGVGFGGFTGAR